MWTLRILYPHDIRWYCSLWATAAELLESFDSFWWLGEVRSLMHHHSWHCVINDSFFRRDHRSIIAHCHLTKAYQEYPRILEMLPGKLCRKPNIWWIMGSSPANDQTWRRGSKSGDRSLYFFLVNRPHHRNTDIFDSINSMFICCNPYHWLGSLSNSHYVTMLSRIPSAEAVCSSTEVGSQGRWLGRSIGILWAQNSKVGEVVGMQVLLFEA